MFLKTAYVMSKVLLFLVLVFCGLIFPGSFLWLVFEVDVYRSAAIGVAAGAICYWFASGLIEDLTR